MPSNTRKSTATEPAADTALERAQAADESASTPEQPRRPEPAPAADQEPAATPEHPHEPDPEPDSHGDVLRRLRRVEQILL